jgi:hypothetical protein
VSYLDAFINKEYPIKVGGRLQKSVPENDQRHQIRLSTKHFLTLSIIKQEHSRNFSRDLKYSFMPFIRNVGL